jgi:hypothetical protein
MNMELHAFSSKQLEAMLRAQKGGKEHTTIFAVT